MKTVECLVHGVICTNAENDTQAIEVASHHRDVKEPETGCYFDIIVYETKARPPTPAKGTVSKME